MSRILMIEPDSKLAGVYAAALQLRGHDVDMCRLAQEAISQADACKPDLVLLELGLTAHGGIEFLYEFRSYADWRTVPVIIVSHIPADSFSGSRDVLERQLGVTAYHYKPRLSLRTLVSEVEKALASPDEARLAP